MEQIHARPMADKTVLVTGGSGGIGLATALGLATMGARLGSSAETAYAPRLRQARSAQPAAGRSTCSSPTCPHNRSCGVWPMRCWTATAGSMC